MSDVKHDSVKYAKDLCYVVLNLKISQQCKYATDETNSMLGLIFFLRINI